MEPLRDGAVGPEGDLGDLGEVGGVEEDELDVVHGGRAQEGEEQHAVVLGNGLADAAVVAVLAAAADSRPRAELD